MTLRLFIITSFIFISCQNKHDDNFHGQFELPKVINSKYHDSIVSKNFSEEFFSHASPVFAGKYKNQLTIDINPKLRTGEYLTMRETKPLLDSFDTNGFDIIVDYTQTVKNS